MNGLYDLVHCKISCDHSTKKKKKKSNLGSWRGPWGFNEMAAESHSAEVSVVEASHCVLNHQNAVNLSMFKYNVGSKRAANFKTKARRTCFAFINYVWSVSATPKRSCGCEINLNLTDLHGNGYWLADTATQLYADENISHLLLALLSLGKDKSHRDENVIFWGKHSAAERAHPPSVPSASRMWVCKGERIKTGYAIKLLHTRQRKCDPCGAHPRIAACEIGSHSWMKNNVHTRSGTQLDSTSESRCVVSLTSSINITKIFSSKAASAATELTAEGCCCQKTWRRTLSRWK